MTRDDASTAAPSREVLTFRLGAESYGIDILHVKEIRSYEPATAIPNSPEELKGVVNLRGTIVPIMDLRLRFGLRDARYDDSTVTIILDAGAALAGWVVDSVSEVVTVSEVRDPPESTQQPGRRWVSGLAPQGDRMIILLDTEALLARGTQRVAATEPFAQAA